MEQAAVRVFWTRRADKLLDNNMYKLVESEDFTPGVVRHVMKSLNFTVPVIRFEKQQAVNVVASEAKSRRNVNLEIPVNEEWKPS